MPLAIDHLPEALKAHQQGDLATAESLYRQVLDVEAERVDALNLLGVLCAQTERVDEGRMLLQRAVQADPNNVSPRFNLANVLRDTKQLRSAVREYRGVLQRQPDHAGALLNLAATHVGLDRPGAAIEAYHQLLLHHPEHTDARSSLASLLWEHGDHDLARTLLDDTPAGPVDAPLLALRASMDFEDGEFRAAVDNWKRAAALEPECVDHPHNLGQALRQLAEHDAAAEAFARAATLMPGEPRFVKRLIETLFDAGRNTEAIAACEALVTAETGTSLGHHQRADLLREFGRPREAAAQYQLAAEIDGDDPVAWCNLSGCLLLLGQSHDAIAAGHRAIAIDEDLSEAHMNLAAAHLDRRELRQAIEHAETALTIKPDLFNAHTTLAAAMRQAGKPQAAIEQLQKLTTLHPTSADAWTRLGHAQREAGVFSDAKNSYRRASQLEANYPDAEVGTIKITLATTGPEECLPAIDRLLESGRVHPYIATTAAEVFLQTGRAAEVVPLLEPIATDERQPARDRRTISMRLGETHDQLGDYDQAFEWYARANRMLENVYDEPTTRAAMARLTEVFDPAWLERTVGGDDAFRPIFIAGMPRSGTTLVEQILASHPDVAGVGEIGLAAEAAASVARITNSATAYPDSAQGLDPDSMTQLATWCVGQLRNHARESDRIVEKSPTNSLHMPLLAALFPRARFIWCQRDALDTCLSCYFHDFVGHYPYTYDLAHLGHYHTMHTELMQAWQERLGDRLLPVRYEDVVGQLEPQTRRLLEFCDLSWNPACLDFHTSRRTVLTASRDQVRKPLYSSSIGRAKKYESHLASLRQALDEPMPLRSSESA